MRGRLVAPAMLLILGACSPAPAPATSSVTAVPATATAAAASTPAPTRTPAPPPTPTPVDINHLPPGETVHIELKSIKGNELVNGDFINHTVGGTLNGGITMMKHSDTPFGFKDMLPMYVYVQDGIAGVPYFRETPRKGLLTQYLETVIVKRFADDTGLPLRQDTYDLAFSKMQTGTGMLPLAFTTGEGDFRYYPSAEHGYRVFIVPYDGLDRANDPKVIELHDAQYRFRLVESVDADGNLVYVMGSERAVASVPGGDFIDLVFLGLSRVISTADQSERLLLQQKMSRVMWDIPMNAEPTITFSNTP